jgi:hypothetical protein
MRCEEGGVSDEDLVAGAFAGDGSFDCGNDTFSGDGFEVADGAVETTVRSEADAPSQRGR